MKKEPLFQWGHDFSAMDRGKALASAFSLARFQWGHDFSAMDREFWGRSMKIEFFSFNGATTFQPWIAELMAAKNELTPLLFQWGHDFSAMDSIYLLKLIYKVYA